MASGQPIAERILVGEEWPHPRVWRERSNLPHVFILGAGASKAACAHDANGLLVPLMNEIVLIPEIAKEIPDRFSDDERIDFESLFHSLTDNEKRQIEAAIRSYFERLQLPDRVTIYDQIILGLRPKDLIASFNWDPLLEQARRRNENAAPLPRIVYLHGNVTQGHCADHGFIGSLGTLCRNCNKPLEPVPLLYPIREKNYQSTAIGLQWACLQESLSTAYFLTIFGYRAPSTDVEAISLMKGAYDRNLAKVLAEIHIIDLRRRRELRAQWSGFTVGLHYVIAKKLSQCWNFVNYPRRSCEALAQASLKCEPWPENPIPKFRSIAHLQEWIRPLVREEAEFMAGNIEVLTVDGIR